jgi:hypothetical protein
MGPNFDFAISIIYLISLKKMAVPYEASYFALRAMKDRFCEVWRSLVDAFRERRIKFTISLNHIQTAFIELGILN